MKVKHLIRKGKEMPKTEKTKAPTKRVQPKSKWDRCPRCKLRIRAEGKTAEDRLAAHEAGCHCAKPGSNKAPSR